MHQKLATRLGPLLLVGWLAISANGQSVEPAAEEATEADVETAADVISPRGNQPKVPQVPATRVEGNRDAEKPEKPTEPERKPLTDQEKIAERLPTYLHKQGSLNQPLRVEEISRGGKPPFVRRETLIYADGTWERAWMIGERLIPGATGRLTRDEMRELAEAMATYDLAAQPRVAPANQPRFAQRVAYESVRLDFGRDRWNTERLFAEAKIETDPQKATPQDRILFVTQTIRRLTAGANGDRHPIDRVYRPFDQTSPPRVVIPNGSRQANGSP